MPKNPNKPRTRRLLLEAVGVGTSVALFGCSSSSTVEPMTGVLVSDAAMGVQGMPTGSFAADAGAHGVPTFDAAGSSVPEDAGSHGREPEDAGPMGKVAEDAAVDAGGQG
jgi:hypothetical protein